jgi:hypothetical protein
MPRVQRFWSRFIPVICLTAAAAACDTDAAVLSDPPAFVVVTPTTAQLVVGDTVRLRAQGTPMTCGCRWSTRDSTIAVTDATGLVRAIGPGRTFLTAFLERYPEVSSVALIEVTAP